MLAAVKLAALFVLAGCISTTTSTMSPSSAKLECLDCGQPIATGQPIRVVSSWVGSCVSEGYTAFFSEDKESGRIEWKKTQFSETKACDEHHYKLAVTCSSKCVVRAIDSPDTSTVKLLGIYPRNSGKFTFSIELRRTKEGEAVARFASDEMLVRAPDEIAPFESDRKIDGPSPLAVFAGFEYFLEPGTARAGKPPDRGTRYHPAPVEQPPDNADMARPDGPDRLQRDCKTRTPGAIAWRPCTQGVHAGDDVRIDVTPWLGNQRMSEDVTLVELGGEATETMPATETTPWTCYRATFAVPGSQICVRYGVPVGEHTLHWQGFGSVIVEKLVVGGAP